LISDFFLFFHHELHSLLIQLGIPLLHELLEGEEIVHRHDLVDDAFVDWVLTRFLARLHENLLCDSKLSQQVPYKLLNQILEIIVDLCVFQFVLILGIKNDTIFIKEAHDGRLPAWRPQEVNDNVKEPIVLTLWLVLFFLSSLRRDFGTGIHFFISDFFFNIYLID